MPKTKISISIWKALTSLLRKSKLKSQKESLRNFLSFTQHWIWEIYIKLVSSLGNKMDSSYKVGCASLECLLFILNRNTSLSMDKTCLLQRLNLKILLKQQQTSNHQQFFIVNVPTCRINAKAARINSAIKLQKVF